MSKSASNKRALLICIRFIQWFKTVGNIAVIAMLIVLVGASATRTNNVAKVFVVPKRF
jgi:hypothetical protein